jgi:hypothetical protein
MKLEVLTLLGIGYCHYNSSGYVTEYKTLFDETKVSADEVKKVQNKGTPMMQDGILIIKDRKGVLVLDKQISTLRHDLLDKLNSVHGLLELIVDNTQEDETHEMAKLGYDECKKLDVIIQKII